MPRVFIIGGTGFIGGAVLDKIVSRHPDVVVTVLVRSKDKATRLEAKYPSVRTVIGDLDSYKLLEEEGRLADVVVNTAPDITHDDGIASILDGMREHKPNKSYYIHTSGGSNVWDEPNGSKDAVTWDDFENIEKITSQFEDFTHFDTDELVREAAPDVYVANISPAVAFGLSPSIEHPCPMILPALIQVIRNLKTGFQVAEGENQLGFAHIEDLSDMYMTLVEKGLAGGGETENGVAVWGPQAYYFGVAEMLVFRDFMQQVVAALSKIGGVLKGTEIKSVSSRQLARLASDDWDSDDLPPADSWAAYITLSFGVNMRVRSTRAQKLGWKPKAGSVTGTMEETFSEFFRLEKEQKN